MDAKDDSVEPKPSTHARTETAHDPMAELFADLEAGRKDLSQASPHDAPELSESMDAKDDSIESKPSAHSRTETLRDNLIDPIAEMFADTEASRKDREYVEPDALSEDSVNDENSDDEDVFEIKCAEVATLTSEYKSMWLFRWQKACAELGKNLRHNVRLPLDPREKNCRTVWTDVDTGVGLPPWHCAFAQCDAVDSSLKTPQSHEHNVW